IMSEKEPGVVIGVRNGSPLVAALDPEGGAIVASDAQAILEFTKDVYFLEHGEMVIGTAERLEFFDLASGKPSTRPSTRLDWSLEKLDKQGFAHYMLKEIHEQPAAMVDTLNGILDRARAEPFPLASQPGVELLQKAKDITLVACGTSWHAALLGKYWLEKWARLPVSVELASEFRYRDPVLTQDSLVIGVSQSGETADTLAVLREIRSRGVPTLGITNVRGSSIAREAHATFYMSAGPEIGVAATKTFTTQMLMLLAFAGNLGVRRGGKDAQSATRIFEELLKLPHLLSDLLEKDGELLRGIRATAKAVQNSKGFFFIGRGYSYPVALEGALKLKEIAYVHAEGYAAGELKHGPIAMIDEGMTVIVLAPRDLWRDKTVSNLEEVKARGAKILGVGAASDEQLRSLCDHWIPVAIDADESLQPFLMTPVIQLLSYELALLKGTDVDKPRNLAKSVTVE
ncbi:MAG: glutamine--fructose-6-phosphate transaminase (isomerizing), partial [Bdellovibrionota bacterium]